MEDFQEVTTIQVTPGTLETQQLFSVDLQQSNKKDSGGNEELSTCRNRKDREIIEFTDGVVM